MHISLIFWISIALATFILIGKSVINFDFDAKSPHEEKQTAYIHSDPSSFADHEYVAINESRQKKPTLEDSSDTLTKQYESPSKYFPDNEQAALALAEKLLEAKNIEEYESLQQQWQRNADDPRWVFLDVRAKLLTGKTKEAAKILESNKFKGKEETNRLVSLAGLYLVENPKKSLAYLSEAVQNDPQNPDLHLFKASLSETITQNRTASDAYISAIKLDTENPHRREMLADFYLRTRQYPQALAILQDTMNPPSLDSIWLKAAFWNRMTTPFKIEGKEQEIPQGNLKNLAAYVLSLPQGIYWNEQAFKGLPNSQYYLSQQQETFWLQLLSALKSGQEHKALTLLLENPFQSSSWAPDLEKGLKTLLYYRLHQNGSGRGSSFLLPQNGLVETPPQFLQFLASLSETPTETLPSAIPEQMRDLLLGEDAFVIPFLALGWNEAALQLHTMKKIPEHYPEWVAVSLAKAINQNRGSKAALSFALEQPASPSLSLFLAESALEAGEERLAFNTLKEIYTRNDESGKKAAWILGQFLIKHNNLADAKKALTTHSSEEPAVKEALARIALEQGDLNGANALYLQIENKSSEAKSFLAKKAFADKNWGRARLLTESLLKDHPNNPKLEENLIKIKMEEQKLILKSKTNQSLEAQK